MSRRTNRDDGALVRKFLSVADLLEEPELAQLYAYLTREGETTVQELMEALELTQSVFDGQGYGDSVTFVNAVLFIEDLLD